MKQTTYRKKIIWLPLCMALLPLSAYANNGIDPFCNGNNLLELTDRGSVTNTPCVVQQNVAMAEAGYLYQQYDDHITAQRGPQPFLFIGLPNNSELFVSFPNYNHLSFNGKNNSSGVSATTLGLKHKITYAAKWSTAAEVLVTPPSGDNVFGSQGTGVNINGILGYLFTPQLRGILMVGGSTATTAVAEGGRRFQSFNPSFVLIYKPKENYSFFAEVFGQTKTRPEDGGNYNINCGFLYLITPNLAFDIEAGQQLTHLAAVSNQFIGTGLSFTFL